jgi:putative endonuclease
MDVIAMRPGLVVFVEVKTRSSRGHGLPEEAVDPVKCQRLVRGARAWLRRHGRPGLRARFDVVAVEPDDSGQLCVRHLPAAFDASP